MHSFLFVSVIFFSYSLSLAIAGICISDNYPIVSIYCPHRFFWLKTLFLFCWTTSFFNTYYHHHRDRSSSLMRLSPLSPFFLLLLFMYRQKAYIDACLLAHHRATNPPSCFRVVVLVPIFFCEPQVGGVFLWPQIVDWSCHTHDSPWVRW